MSQRTIALISTGGTIDKTYDELEGVLHNQVSVLDVMIASLVLEGVQLVRVPLMNKDSLEMTDKDHTLVAQTAGNLAEAHDGVVIDLRTAEAYSRGHIVNAKNIPFDEFDAASDKLTKFRNKPVIAVCDSGISSERL